MALDPKNVQDIARLARLQIDSQEIDQYCKDLSSILDLVAQMDNIDTSQTEPMTHPFDANLRLREDKVTATNQRDALQALAPEAESGLYLVPKVID